MRRRGMHHMRDADLWFGKRIKDHIIAIQKVERTNKFEFLNQILEGVVLVIWGKICWSKIRNKFQL